jgi:hypothetical protein
MRQQEQYVARKVVVRLGMSVNLRSCQILPRKVGRRTERNRICELKAGEGTNRPWSGEPERLKLLDAGLKDLGVGE